MELPEIKIDELLDMLVNKIKIAASIESDVNELLAKRVDYLDKDIVLK